MVVFDLGVADAHTYYAGRPSSALLVHNCSEFDEDQQALIQLAKGAKRRGGVSPQEAKILDEWRTEYKVGGHRAATHGNRAGSWSARNVHISVGPIRHIPVSRLGGHFVE